MVPLAVFNVPLFIIEPFICNVELVTVTVAAFCIVIVSTAAIPESNMGKTLPASKVVGINVSTNSSGTNLVQLPGVYQSEVPAAPVHEVATEQPTGKDADTE